MKRRKSPRLKKRDEYEKDHRTSMENPHAFRKNWPKKKARANRRSRLRLNALLRAEGDFTPAKAAIGPKAVQKHGVKRLRDFVALKKSVRARLANRRARAVRFRIEGASAVLTTYEHGSSP